MFGWFIIFIQTHANSRFLTNQDAVNRVSGEQEAMNTILKVAKTVEWPTVLVLALVYEGIEEAARAAGLLT